MSKLHFEISTNQVLVEVLLYRAFYNLVAECLSENLEMINLHQDRACQENLVMGKFLYKENIQDRLFL